MYIRSMSDLWKKEHVERILICEIHKSFKLLQKWFENGALCLFTVNFPFGLLKYSLHEVALEDHSEATIGPEHSNAHVVAYS